MTNTQKIITGWVAYAERNNLRSGTQKYQREQHAYIVGCNTMLGDEAGLPPIIQIYVMCGRDIADLKQEAVA